MKMPLGPENVFRQIDQLACVPLMVGNGNEDSFPAQQTGDVLNGIGEEIEGIGTVYEIKGPVGEGFQDGCPSGKEQPAHARPATGIQKHWLASLDDIHARDGRPGMNPALETLRKRTEGASQIEDEPAFSEVEIFRGRLADISLIGREPSNQAGSAPVGADIIKDFLDSDTFRHLPAPLHPLHTTARTPAGLSAPTILF